MNKRNEMIRNCEKKAGRAAGLLTAGLLLGWFSPALGHGPDPHGETAFGRPGDAGQPAKQVEIVMTDADGNMRFNPSSITATAGEQIRFRIHNKGELDHEFMLATHEANLKHAEEMRKNPEMEHDEPNMKRLKPNETREVLWRFTKPGTFHIGCLIPGHLEAGMEASIVVTSSTQKAK